MRYKITDYFGKTFLFGNMNQSMGLFFIIMAIIGSFFLEEGLAEPDTVQFYNMLFQGFLLMGIGSIGIALGQIMKLIHVKPNDLTDV